MTASMPHRITKERLSPREFYHEYMLPGLPVIIQNRPEWPAFEKWSVDYLMDRCGEARFVHNEQDLVFGEVLDRSRSSAEDAAAPYVKNIHLQRLLPDLMHDLQPRLEYAEPNYLRSRLVTPRFRQQEPIVELFVGGRGTRIPYLHYDEHYLHNFVTQVCGKKEFYFFGPEQSHRMYPLEDNPYFSQVRDPRDPDLDRFPEFAEADCQKLTVEPGETVFVAAGWWHWTFMPDVSIAVGHHCVNATNWAMWRDDICTAFGRDRQPKWRLMRAYLSAITPLLEAGHPIRMRS